MEPSTQPDPPVMGPISGNEAAVLPPRRITVGLIGLVFSAVALSALAVMTLLRPG